MAARWLLSSVPFPLSHKLIMGWHVHLSMESDSHLQPPGLPVALGLPLLPLRQAAPT